MVNGLVGKKKRGREEERERERERESNVRSHDKKKKLERTTDNQSMHSLFLTNSEPMLCYVISGNGRGRAREGVCMGCEWTTEGGSQNTPLYIKTSRHSAGVCIRFPIGYPDSCHLYTEITNENNGGVLYFRSYDLIDVIIISMVLFQVETLASVPNSKIPVPSILDLNS